MERTSSRRAIDGPDELPMLGCRALGVTVARRNLEPLRQRLDRRAVTEVLQALTTLGPNPLLLLLDIRHSRKRPQLRAGRW